MTIRFYSGMFQVIFLYYAIINFVHGSDGFLNRKITLNETQSRCPLQTDKPGIYLFSDKKLCNVYHECSCIRENSSQCTFVRTNVCPFGTIFLNSSNRCEPIELYGCETSYLQSISSAQFVKRKNQTLESDYDSYRKDSSSIFNLPPESVNITGMSDFLCPYGANERFPDPQICNIFHVCVSRGDQTYDQPFLCPFSTVFRVIDTNTMYCEKKTNNDCLDKAFYRSIDDEDMEIAEDSYSILIESSNVTSPRCTMPSNNRLKLENNQYCNLYNVCLGDREATYMCENQLLYNPLSQICDYPVNVVCLNKQIYKVPEKVPEPVTTTTTTTVKQEYKSLRNVSIFKPLNTIQNNVNQIQNFTAKNGSQVNIHGVKIELNCPIGVKNYLIPDKKYCNVFHHCHGNYGNVFVCDRGQAFDALANGPEKSGVCNFEESVNCAGKFIISETGQRPGQAQKPIPRSTSVVTGQGNADKLSENYMKQDAFSYMPQIANSREELVSGIPFDCRGKANGHWKDQRYCDVFHACIGGEQKKTYSCAQLGERIYFDETTKRCEFLRNNPFGCTNNMFYQMLKTTAFTNSFINEEPSESWKQFIRSREPFSCLGRMDGFYASRWCNVFYRCFIGVKTEFLCPKMLNSDRLWWVQHGSSQETPQTSAACVWPCETKKQCLSPGGSIVERGDNTYEESPMEAERVWRNANCAAETSSINDIFKIADNDFSCAGLPEGNFYPSKYCNVFHRCTNGKRRDFQCAKATNSPYDLWWNEATNQCDWPCKVQCTKPVYGSSKLASDIRFEDRSLNEEECRGAKNALVPINTTPAPIPVPLPVVTIPSKQVTGPSPDEGFVCRTIGFAASYKYCNVYYECKLYGQLPKTAFYCTDGFFDSSTKTCKPSSVVQCSLNPQLMYPYVSLPESNAPEEVGCSNTIGPYLIHSNRYCNIYYTCDGRSSKPLSYRCYDRNNLEDAVFNRETRKCESKHTIGCQGEFLAIKLRYQSSPIDHTRLPDLQPLSCRADQQYLAEHDKYCNLYHSCILGKYQMYACVTLGSFDKTSYFYYTNGDCAAPNSAQCGPNKGIYPYEKLFPTDIETLLKSNSNQGRYAPIMSPSINYRGQASFGSVSIKNVLPNSPLCTQDKNNLLVPHEKYCNIFYECMSGKLSTYACVDSSTGLFSGIFDDKLKGCKPFSLIDCPSNSLYNPDGANPEYTEIKTEMQSYTDYSFKTESNFTCIGRTNGYYESEWCNIFFRCVDGKRIDARCSSGQKNQEYMQYDLWWEHQNITYDPVNPYMFRGLDEDAKCEWPCKVKCNKPVWIENGRSQDSKSISDRDRDLHSECLANPSQEPVKQIQFFSTNVHYEAFETENLNPSGFYCETDGTFKDSLFCNIFHVCTDRIKKTYQCKSLDGYSQSVSLFDQDKQACVSKEEGFPKCNGIIFDSNFMNLPAYRNLPSTIKPCIEPGVYRAYDKDVKYCDLYYWCSKPYSEPVYFYCDYAVLNKDTAFFNFDTRQCDSSSNVKCEYPYKIYSHSLQSKNFLQEKEKQSQQIRNQQQVALGSQNLLNIKNLVQQSPYMMQILSGLLDPAPGYLSLPATQFQTNFQCPLNSPGYYPNSDYCDIFHYCYNNGQFKTYVCASMQNQFQLWWSHQTEPGRRDNIFCDWPCNLVGPNTVCPAHKRVLMRDRQQIQGGIAQQEVLSSTCPNSATSYINNSWKNIESSTSNYELISTTNQQAQIMTKNSAAVTGYSPCSNSLDWYVSPKVIKCSPENKAHGFAPDPKDCSKFYRCDQNIEADGFSIGYLMSCVAGLWWDQSKRMCVSPTEVTCNPYSIINTYGNEQGICKFTCAQVGLTIRNLMKNVPGKPNAFYKCDGQCAVEMRCPLDLIFDNNSQRCEWLHTQARMASLKLLNRNLNQTSDIIDTLLSNNSSLADINNIIKNSTSVKTLLDNNVVVEKSIKKI